MQIIYVYSKYGIGVVGRRGDHEERTKAATRQHSNSLQNEYWECHTIKPIPINPPILKQFPEKMKIYL